MFACHLLKLKLTATFGQWSYSEMGVFFKCPLFHTEDFSVRAAGQIKQACSSPWALLFYKINRTLNSLANVYSHCLVISCDNNNMSLLFLIGLNNTIVWPVRIDGDGCGATSSLVVSSCFAARGRCSVAAQLLTRNINNPEPVPVPAEHGGFRTRVSGSPGPVRCGPFGSGSQAVLDSGCSDNPGLSRCYRRHPPALFGPGHATVPGRTGLHAQSGAGGKTELGSIQKPPRWGVGSAAQQRG